MRTITVNLANYRVFALNSAIKHTIMYLMCNIIAILYVKVYKCIV